MKSNIEKLLDALIKVQGEKLVLGTDEPPYIFKKPKKFCLMERILSEMEFESLSFGFKVDRTASIVGWD